MYLKIFILCFLSLTHHALSAMTEKQMKAAMKLVRNTCMSKTKSTDAEIDAHHKGDFSGGQCYLLCILNTYKLLNKEGSFEWEAGIKAVEANAPPELTKIAAKSIENCKDSLKTKDDMCIGATEIVKCIYNDNPEKYFLP